MLRGTCVRRRYAVLSFVIVGLAEGSVVLSVLTNGFVLPLIAASIRTAALSVLLPICQKSMADQGGTKAEIDAFLGSTALAFEIVLALPAFAFLMRNPSVEAAFGSAITLMVLEVVGKQAYLAYFRLRHDGDPAALRSALDMLEVRLVYEEVGEKLCILVAPILAYMLDRGKEGRAPIGQLFLATFCIFAMEELVDSLLLIVMARHGVNALHVKPTFNLRMALKLGVLIAAEFGVLLVADKAMS